MTCEIYDSNLYDKSGKVIGFNVKKINWNGFPEYDIPPQEIECHCTGKQHLWKDDSGCEWSCECPVYTEEKRGERDRKNQKNKKGKIMTIHNFRPEINKHHKQLAQVRNFPKSTYKVLIMTGNNGTGKTHLLNGLRKECLDNKMSTVYFEWKDLIDSFIPDKSDYNYDLRDNVNLVRDNKVDVMFIDELRKDMKQFYYDELSYLIENFEGKIAIACNLPAKNVDELFKIGSIPDRLKSRLFNNMEFVLMEGKDCRGIKKLGRVK